MLTKKVLLKKLSKFWNNTL